MNVVEPSADPFHEVQADDVAKTALADVQFLCEQRFGDVRSSELTEEILATFEERLPAYLDALLTRGPHVIPWLVQSLATAAMSSEVCGIAVVLLESRDSQAVQGVLSALETAQEESKLHGLHLALRRGPIDLLVQPLQRWFASGSPRQATAAAEVLAYHRRLPQNFERLTMLCSDADPRIRRAAWRAAALTG